MRSRHIGPHLLRNAAVLAVVMLLVCVSAAWAAKTETFVPTTIQYPGSTSTTARGINKSGDIVGTYVCAAACVNPMTGETSPPGTHGFLLQDGVYTRIDVPGGTGTVARGISERGTIVGHYNVGAVTHGFAYFEGFYLNPIDVPAEDFDHPASPLRDTLPVRIASNGEIVGFYLSSGVSYVAKRNVIATTFTFEGNLFTLAWDVNARGDIVGVHGDNQANTVGAPVKPHGFLRTKDGEYRSLDVQG